MNRSILHVLFAILSLKIKTQIKKKNIILSQKMRYKQQFTMNTGITVKLEKEGMTDYENNEFKILSPV